MAVAYDAFSVSAGGTGTQTWTHTPVGTPRGVIVWVQTFSGVDEISTVTYGGVACTEVTGSPNLLTTGEQGGSNCFYLGAGIPTGAQSVVATATGTTTSKVGYCVTITAAADTEVVDTDATINSTSLLDPSATLSLGGRTCFAAIAFNSGQDAVTGYAPLTNWTARSELDGGTECLGCYTYDTIGSTDVTAGWTQTAEDAVAVAIAVSEVVAGGTLISVWMTGGMRPLSGGMRS